MSNEKLPPSQLTLTQMSRDDRKSRCMDEALLASIHNIQRREFLTLRGSKKLLGQSRAKFEPIDHGANNTYNHSDSSDEDFVRKKRRDNENENGKTCDNDESSISPCLLPAFHPSTAEVTSTPAKSGGNNSIVMNDNSLGEMSEVHQKK